VEIKASEGAVVKVGDVIAVLENDAVIQPEVSEKIEKEVERIRETIDADRREKKEELQVSREMKSRTPSGKFLSPLVRNIAVQEGISYSDLDKITGTGMDGRITRDDIFR
jgi:2-oxoglutarate dehydrogenase E2 component (dihydrolipoamide succinyltransferase)